MTNTIPPLTDDIPPRRTRAALKWRAFIYHPAVMAGEVAFLAGVVAAVIYWILKNGFMS